MFTFLAIPEGHGPHPFHLRFVFSLFCQMVSVPGKVPFAPEFQQTRMASPFCQFDTHRAVKDQFILMRL